MINSSTQTGRLPLLDVWSRVPATCQKIEWFLSNKFSPLGEHQREKRKSLCSLLSDVKKYTSTRRTSLSTPKKSFQAESLHFPSCFWLGE